MTEVICRDCEIEFNPSSPAQTDRLFYNQCIDCAEQSGVKDVGKVKGVINTTEEGDFGSVSVVSSEQFEKYRKIMEENTGMVKKGG